MGDFFAERHVGQGSGGLSAVIADMFKQGQGCTGLGQRCPAGLATIEIDGGEGVGRGEAVCGAAIEAGATGEIIDTVEATSGGAGGNNAGGGGLFHTLDLAQTQTHGKAASALGGGLLWPGSRFQRAVPVGSVDVGRAHFNAVFAGISDQLGGGVKSHRLGVEQGGEEDVGEVVFDPAGDVDNEGEAGGMAFGKAVFAKALELFETALGKLALIALGEHAGDQFFAHFIDRAGAAKGGHGAAQLVGFRRRETGSNNGDAHGLFLEKRDAQRLAQHLLEGL